MSRGSYYYIDIRHEGLNKFRRIKGADKGLVEELAAKQKAIWDAQWVRRQDIKTRRYERENAALQRQAQKETAIERTREAEVALKELDEIFLHTLSIDDTLRWDSLKKKERFPEKTPIKTEKASIPKKPELSDAAFKPQLTILDRIISSWRVRKENDANDRYNIALRTWQDNKDRIEKANSDIDRQNEEATKEWEVRKAAFLKDQESYNQGIDQRRQAYQEKNPDAIREYCELVLSNSEYPDYFPAEFELDYNPINKILLVDYNLPSPDVIPLVKEVKYIQSKDDFKEIYLTDSQFNKLYDDLIYKIALRTIHELFEADQTGVISSIVFNGWVRSIDKSTGQETNACILSVQAKKEEFFKINLGQVDPKTCFKSLKGIASSKLHSLTPVSPILYLVREDSRFISSYDVAHTLDESTNIAAMDWVDFEHLIRELFEKEFSQSGGEVKVTQASRDGGVDAIAFDPDPIRGGKIVIQAKRYTNTVGVAAVRDLYGTVVNEGASKGILVTTSDYGPDAYDFAQGKPLTLLSGSNLLHLLGKHGHKAKIDVKEAKRILSEREK